MTGPIESKAKGLDHLQEFIEFLHQNFYHGALKKSFRIPFSIFYQFFD